MENTFRRLDFHTVTKMSLPPPPPQPQHDLPHLTQLTLVGITQGEVQEQQQ